MTMTQAPKYTQSTILDPGTSMPFTRREDVFELYWYYACERQMIYSRRLAGSQPPYTEDPILQANKFCNTYRVLDHVSQDLIVRIVNDPITFEDDAFRTVLYRFFSKPETLTAIESTLGDRLRLEHLANTSLDEALARIYDSGATMYTSAFILCANNAYGYPRKYQNHLALFKDIFLASDFLELLLEAPEIGEVQLALKQFPLIGDFMSFQIAVDLGYLDWVTFSQDQTVVAGPGALRGIAKAFEDLGGMVPAEVIHHCWEHQEQYFENYGFDFPYVKDRRLDLVDCQGLFCELDKYCRLARPELKSARKRMKQPFRGPTHQVTCELPLKWCES